MLDLSAEYENQSFIDNRFIDENNEISDSVLLNNALYTACYYGDIDLIRYVLKEFPKDTVLPQDDCYDSPILIAAQRKHYEAVYFLISNGYHRFMCKLHRDNVFNLAMKDEKLQHAIGIVNK